MEVPAAARGNLSLVWRVRGEVLSRLPIPEEACWPMTCCGLFYGRSTRSDMCCDAAGLRTWSSLFDACWLASLLKVDARELTFWRDFPPLYPRSSDGAII